MDVNINRKTQSKDQTRTFIKQKQENEIESKSAHRSKVRMRSRASPAADWARGRKKEKIPFFLLLHKFHRIMFFDLLFFCLKIYFFFHYAVSLRGEVCVRSNDNEIKVLIWKINDRP